MLLRLHVSYFGLIRALRVVPTGNALTAGHSHLHSLYPQTSLTTRPTDLSNLQEHLPLSIYL